MQGQGQLVPHLWRSLTGLMWLRHAGVGSAWLAQRGVHVAVRQAGRIGTYSPPARRRRGGVKSCMWVKELPAFCWRL